MSISLPQFWNGNAKKPPEKKNSDDNIYKEWRQGYIDYQSDIEWDNNKSDWWKEGYLYAHEHCKGYIPQAKE